MQNSPEAYYIGPDYVRGQDGTYALRNDRKALDWRGKSTMAFSSMNMRSLWTKLPNWVQLCIQLGGPLLVGWLSFFGIEEATGFHCSHCNWNCSNN